MKVPLRTILKNFLNHVEDLEKRQKLGDDQYETEFQELKKLTDKLKEDPAYPSSVAFKDVNRPKNRYKDIVPYDFSRVILPKYDGIPGSDYINASYVKGASGAFAYIAAQGPLPNTVVDFWRMIWVCEVQVIVMACNEQEAGRYKCEKYWPEEKQILNFGNVSVEMVQVTQVCPDFLVRTLLVKCDSEMRDVYQFHYTSWPDHGAPDVVQPILELVRLMRDCQASETVPILVHCSAGCGRTGTICAVDFVWACLRHGKLDEDFSFFNIALELRRQRIAMIQTKEQYILAHKAVATMFEQQLKVIDCHIYENIDEDGEPLMWKELSMNIDSPLTEWQVTHKTVIETDSKSNADLASKIFKSADLKPSSEKHQQSEKNAIYPNSSKDNTTSSKISISDSLISSKNSDSSFSRNSYLSEQNNDEAIPFIDEDEILFKPNSGRAYLNIPSCESISKLMDRFDPFVDQISVGTDDSSPEGDTSNKLLEFNSSVSCAELKKYDNEENSKGIQLTDSNEQSNFHKFATLSICPKNGSPDIISNRESYPPSSSKKNFDSDLMQNKSQSSTNDASMKLVGKATVVRRPSISKLKALFEKSAACSSKAVGDVTKRSLFRHNSHYVSRAGSAPPSLNCMNENAEVERDSILMMVTRKFRSSSVRSEREPSSKQTEKSTNKKSATGALNNFKDSICSLSRNMSLSFNKTFKSSSCKAKVDHTFSKEPLNPVQSHAKNVNPCKIPETQTRGKSTWYDKSSLPRAVAIVKPTEKIPAPPAVLVKYKPLKQDDDKIECKEPTNPVINKGEMNVSEAKSLIGSSIKETNLNAKTKEPHLNALSENETSSVVSNSTNLKYNSKNFSYKNAPFFQNVTPWKKLSTKSPLTSPTIPKHCSEFYLDSNIEISNSTFYAGIAAPTQNEPPTVTEGKIINVSKCPVPEEIIQLQDTKQAFWPPSTLFSAESPNPELINSKSVPNEPNQAGKTFGESKSEIFFNEKLLNQGSDSVPIQEKKNPYKKEALWQTSSLLNKDSSLNHNDRNMLITQAPGFKETEVLCNLGDKNQSIKEGKSFALVENVTKHSSIQQSCKDEKLTLHCDTPPAIPKKMVIGKNKLSEFSNSTSDLKETLTTAIKNEISPKINNENIIIKNECTVKSEEPVCSSTDVNNDVYINLNKKAVQNIEQIENTLRKNPRGAIIDLTSRESYSMEEDLALAVKQLAESSENTKPFSKNSSKYPGYEVIWPETEHLRTASCRSNKDRAVVMKGNLLKENKTGVCYSPPLRRSLNSSFSLSKSQSCDRLDWLKSNRIPLLESMKDQVSTPEKKLVNKAVVEFSTLLNQLTTRTLAEDVNVKPISEPDSKNKHACIQNDTNYEVFNARRNEMDLSMSSSVTLVAKSCLSGTSLTEEEIVFHFPPPPRVPPPPDVDSHVESFNVSYKNGSLVVTEEKKCEPEKGTNASTTDKTDETFPTPVPRKSKQGANKLKKSASYSNICAPFVKTGYENIFLEKYQTLSRLEIKSNEVNNLASLEPSVPKEKSSHKNSEQFHSKLPNYVNIDALQNHKGTAENVPSKLSGFNDLNENRQVRSKETVLKIDPFSNQSNLFQNSSEKCKDMNDSEIRRKFLPSKKSERAPLPPNLKTDEQNSDERRLSKLDSTPSKKLPSRKLEKAPPPPLLQKSSSPTNLSKLNVQIPPFSTHFPASNTISHESKLPAVRENIPNVDCSKIDERKKRFIHSKENISGRGLSHSQSDVSVYLALKERRALSAKKEVIAYNRSVKYKTPKQIQDANNTSSSDSDSSYEKISQAKPRLNCLNISQGINPEEQNVAVDNGCGSDVPVAPPRSKRRSSTIDLQYAKVKPKYASHLQGTNAAREDILKKNSEAKMVLNQEAPPTVPLKTKDVYKVPGELLVIGTNEAPKTKTTTSKISSDS